MKNKNHIIPKMILHKHSTMPNGYTAYHIWLHNTNTTQDKYVPTDSQCYKHRLYELYDEQRKIVSGTENVIENILAELEAKISPIVQSIQHNQPLSEEAQAGLVLFTAIQIMRTPEVIQFSAEFIQQQAPQLTICQSQQLARIMGLWIQPSLQGNAMLSKILEWLCTHRIIIWRSPWNNSFIINKKRPVGVFRAIQWDITSEIITYPISSTHCIAFINGNQEEQLSYISAPSSLVDWVNYNNYTNDTKWVYSKYKLTELPFYKRLIQRQL